MTKFWKGFSLFAMMYAVTLSVLMLEMGQLHIAAKVAIITASLKSVVAVFHHYVWKRIEDGRAQRPAQPSPNNGNNINT